MKQYEYQIVDIEKLKPYEKNSRTHSSEQIKQIMDSIKAFGFTNPLLIDDDFNLIAGHGRLEAVKQPNKVDFVENPILELPCIIVSGLSEMEQKALVIADNKIALNAGWDIEILGQELFELENANFDISLIGFNEDEVLELLGEFEEVGSIGERSQDNTYTQKIVTPIYEIKGEKPKIEDCVDDSKVLEKIKMIEASNIPQEQKDFLKKTAYRFMDFHFANIAEYYAHSSKEVQELMENLALVIIDYDKAIEEGYVKLTKSIEESASDDE